MTQKYSHVIKQICELMMSQNVEIVVFVLDRLYDFYDKKDSGELFEHSDIFATVLDNFGIFQKLTAMEANENENIRDKASRITAKNFNDSHFH